MRTTLNGDELSQRTTRIHSLKPARRMTRARAIATAGTGFATAFTNGFIILPVRSSCDNMPGESDAGRVMNRVLMR